MEHLACREYREESGWDGVSLCYLAALLDVRLLFQSVLSGDGGSASSGRSDAGSVVLFKSCYLHGKMGNFLLNSPHPWSSRVGEWTTVGG